MLERFFQPGNNSEAGVDEAGRGCLAGPVAAAAVILRPKKHFDWYDELNDSKVLSESKRNELRLKIEKDALAWSVAFADHLEIDTINILNASFLAMHRAVIALRKKPTLLVVDGNRFKAFKGVNHVCVVKGDSKYLHIAAASILAKTHRDDLMQQMHEKFPVYGWNKNKAYATLFHRNAIFTYGLSPYHRKTFHCFDHQLKLEYPIV